MTEALRAGRFVRRTFAPGRNGANVGIVWLDRLSLVEGRRAHPAYGPSAATIGSEGAVGEDDTVRTTVEVPPGYLVVDVRVGYATAAGSFVGELRVVDLGAHRKSALLLLERRPAGDERGAPLFVDAPTAPTGKRTFLSIRASVTDRADHVAVRGLRLRLARA